MNVTLSIDARLVAKARRKAEAMGKSLNTVIREYLEALTGEDAAARDVEELVRLSQPAAGRRRGWKFNRDELHERT
jgi:hypothetical protein